MKTTILIIMTVVLISQTAHSWEGGTTDTVETRYPNGQLEKQYQRFTFDGNERTYLYGFYRTWYENGQKDTEGQYIKDMEEGTWIYRDSTGRRVREVSYHNGLINGKEIEWNVNGTLLKELRYKNNKLHGLSTWFKPHNSIIDVFNHHDLVISFQRFYLEGVLLLPIIDSTRDQSDRWMVGGKEPYYNSEQDLWIEWDNRNTKFWVGKKLNGKKDKVWIQYSQSGYVIKREYYDEGTLLNFNN